MRQKDLISKVIDLEDQARVHYSEYLKLRRAPGEIATSYRNSKLIKLRSRIKNVMRQIAVLRSSLHDEAFEEAG